MKLIFTLGFLSLTILLFSSCVSLPFNSTPPVPQKIERISDFNIDSIVKDQNGKDYFQLQAPVVEHVNQLFVPQKNSDSKEVANLTIKFTAESNSRNSTLFKVWQWAGFLTLGIVPVVEKTSYILEANLQKQSSTAVVQKKAEGYIVFSIFLAPFNLFRNWKEDSLNAEKLLLNELSNDPIFR